MRYRRLHSALVAASIALMLPPARASLTSAAPPADAWEFCDALGMHDAVFIGVAGTPVSRVFQAAHDLRPEPFRVTPFTVERAYRGIDTATVYATEAGPYAIEPGLTYLIHADKLGGPSDLLVVGRASAAADAAREIEFLDTAALSGAGATVHGVVLSGDPDDASVVPRRPLPHVTVRFSSNGQTVDAVTSSDGHYVATGLREGRAELEVLLPHHLTMAGRTRAVRVGPGGCVSLTLIASPNGIIRGRVLRHDGNPFNWFVDLAPADGDLQRRLASTRANERGEFEFVGVLPGEYFVGVNLNQYQFKPFPTTYYPGTFERWDAEPIVIGDATVRDGLDFTLPEPVRPGEIEVRVSGVSATDEVRLCVRGMTDTRETAGAGYTPFEFGAPMRVRVLEGRRYRLVAHVDRGGRHLESQPVDLTATPGRETLTLVPDRRGRTHPVNHVCQPYWYQ
jgi:hypothetical protein